MKHLLLAATLLLATSAVAQTPAPGEPTSAGLAALDAKYGFRGYKFDTPLSELPQLQKFGKRYVDQMELRRFGDVDLSRLDFYVFDGRLCSVVLITEPSALVDHAFAQLIKEYGQPQILGDNQWIWPGKRATIVYTQMVMTANAGYMGIPIKAARITIDTNEAYARRVAQERKEPKLNGSGL